MRSLLAGVCLFAVSCDRGADSAAAHATVVGSTLDVDTREPIAEVEVTGPSDTHAKSDEHGHFRLTGLPQGTAGEIVGRAADGREGRVALRPLEAGSLEVVLYLRTPAAPDAGPAPEVR